MRFTAQKLAQLGKKIAQARLPRLPLFASLQPSSSEQRFTETQRSFEMQNTSWWAGQHGQEHRGAPAQRRRQQRRGGQRPRPPMSSQRAGPGQIKITTVAQEDDSLRTVYTGQGNIMFSCVY